MTTDEEILNQLGIYKDNASVIGCWENFMRVAKLAREDVLKEYEFCKDWPKMITDRNKEIQTLKERAEKAEQNEADFADRVVQLNQDKAKLTEQKTRLENALIVIRDKDFTNLQIVNWEWKKIARKALEGERPPKIGGSFTKPIWGGKRTDNALKKEGV